MCVCVREREREREREGVSEKTAESERVKSRRASYLRRKSSQFLLFVNVGKGGRLRFRRDRYTSQYIRNEPRGKSL